MKAIAERKGSEGKGAVVNVDTSQACFSPTPQDRKTTQTKGVVINRKDFLLLEQSQPSASPPAFAANPLSRCAMNHLGLRTVAHFAATETRPMHSPDAAYKADSPPPLQVAAIEARAQANVDMNKAHQGPGNQEQSCVSIQARTRRPRVEGRQADPA